MRQRLVTNMIPKVKKYKKKKSPQRKEKKKLEQCARERADYLADKERRKQVFVCAREREGALMQPL